MAESANTFMNPILIAFITGLTTGGLSCLAVQGGLLASSLAGEVERTTLAASTKKSQKTKGKPSVQPVGGQMALPIVLFLASKLAAYTLLGFLLGWLGSMLTLTATMRAIFLLLVGIFMIGNALRMLDVHPFFRHFVIEPPRFITRYIRRTAKNGTEIATPLFLGALTVLIPCGVSQAMMAVALATGNPLQGAVIMFAFTLGTSPVFFGVVYLATQIGARMEKYFMRFVAIVVLILGLVSVDSAFNLLGLPSASRTLRQLNQPQVVEQVPADGSAILTLSAANNGYFPQTIYAQAGVPLTLNVVTDNTQSCSRAFVIPALGINTLLPTTGTVPLDIPPQAAETSLFFTCSMGMYTGQIVFIQ